MIIAICARFEIAAADLQSYLDAARPVIHATRQEEGCRLYAFSQDIEQSNVVWIAEEWDSDAALQRHFATEHVMKFREFLKSVTFISRDVRKYTVSEVGGI